MGMSLRMRIGVVFSTLLVTLLLVLSTTFWGYEAARHTSGVVNQTLIPSVDASRELMAASNRLLTDELMYPLDARHRATIQQRFEAHRADFQHWLVEVERHAGTPEEVSLVQQIREHEEAFMAAHDRVRALIAAGDIDEARRISFTEQGPHFNGMLGAASALFQLNRAQIQEMNSQSLSRFDQAEHLSIGITVVGFLVAAMLWWLTARDIVAPLQSLKEAGESLGRGQFVQVHDTGAHRTRELMSLQVSFNEMSARLKEGAERLVEANTSLERQVADRTVELATANRQLQAMVEELKTLDALKSNFMAVMSHELLTPLNFIMGFGSALEDELMGPLNDKQLDTVGKMLAGAERLTRMVRNTLEYTQLEAGTLQVHPEEVRLADVLDELGETMAATFKDRGQTLSIAVPPDTPALRADPDRLRQVFFELLDNAAKFSPQGADVAVSAEADARFVTIAVVDHGEGIPESAIADLTRPFYQADFSLTRAHGGMGLGLAIAHHLVARMGGTLLVDSRLGEGTRIRVVMPRFAPDASGPEARSSYSRVRLDRGGG